ncbi:MAG: hypothetical protein HRT51_07450 [Colwellia sp.]|nr:hypothetical protein [Colwellia sp.]
MADSQYAPYGSLSAEKITERCFMAAYFLITQGVKALVVACNTATAASIQLMRASTHCQLLAWSQPSSLQH